MNDAELGQFPKNSDDPITFEENDHNSLENIVEHAPQPMQRQNIKCQLQVSVDQAITSHCNLLTRNQERLGSTKTTSLPLVASTV